MLNSTKVRDPPLSARCWSGKLCQQGNCPGQRRGGFTGEAPDLTRYSTLVCELVSLENQCTLASDIPAVQSVTRCGHSVDSPLRDQIICGWWMGQIKSKVTERNLRVSIQRKVVIELNYSRMIQFFVNSVFSTRMSENRKVWALVIQVT